MWGNQKILHINFIKEGYCNEKKTLFETLTDLEVNVYKNPTSFSCWSVRFIIEYGKNM